MNHSILNRKTLTYPPASRNQGWLTGALLTLLFFHPILENHRLGVLFLVMIGNVVVLAALYAVSWNNRRLAVGIILAMPSIITTWSFFFQKSLAIGVAQTCSLILFFTYTLITILQRIFRSVEVGIDQLFGALNVYILIGISWGLLYFLIELFNPGAFSYGVLPNSSSTFVYFSFSTLGTLGLGDIHPVASIARSLTIVEMLVGLFFVAVSFGKLVAVFRLEAVSDSGEISDKQPFEHLLKLFSKVPIWSLILLVAIANLVTSILNDKLHMPLFLDTWATSVGVMVGGIWVGLLGGVLYNFLMAALFWGPATWVWAFNTSLVAILTGYFWNRKLLNISRPLHLIGCGLVIAVLNTVLGTIVVNAAGLPRNPSTLEIHKLILAKSNSLFLADFTQQLLMECMDKVVTLVIATIVVFAIDEFRKPQMVKSAHARE